MNRHASIYFHRHLSRASEFGGRTEILDFCREKIADIKAPRRVFFVDRFPMNPQGKIQKFKLREKAVPNLGLKERAVLFLIKKTR